MSYKQEKILLENEDMIVGQLDPVEMNIMGRKESYTDKQNVIKWKPLDIPAKTFDIPGTYIIFKCSSSFKQNDELIDIYVLYVF